jgi:hypothetical protein
MWAASVCMLFLRSMRSAICSRRRGQPSVLVYCRATRPDSSSTASAAALTFVHGEELRRGHAAGKGDYIGLVGQRQQLTYSGALEKIHSVCKSDHLIFPPLKFGCFHKFPFIHLTIF